MIMKQRMKILFLFIFAASIAMAGQCFAAETNHFDGITAQQQYLATNDTADDENPGDVEQPSQDMPGEPDEGVNSDNQAPGDEEPQYEEPPASNDDQMYPGQDQDNEELPQENMPDEQQPDDNK